MSDSTPGRERAARQRLDAPDGFVARVDVDAGLAVVHRHVRTPACPMSVCHLPRVATRPARLQYARRTPAKKRSLLVVLLEHVEPFAQQLERAPAIGARLERRQQSAAYCAARPCRAPAAIGARARDPRGHADVEQRRQRRARFGRPARARASAAADARSSSWKPAFSIGERQRLRQVALVRRAVDAEQADRRRRSTAGVRAAPCRCNRPASSATRLSPILPSASAASSCSGPSSFATAVIASSAYARLVVAERLDHGAAEEVLAAADVAARAPARARGSSP